MMWQKYTGVLVWKTQNPWAGLRGQLYDWRLTPTGAYFGVKLACEPVHIQLNLHSREVRQKEGRRNQQLSDTSCAAIHADVFRRHIRNIKMSEPPSQNRRCPRLHLAPGCCSPFQRAVCAQVEIVNVSASIVRGAAATVQSYTVSRQGTRAGSAGCWEVADSAPNCVMEAGQRCGQASGKGVTLLFLWLRDRAARLLSRNVYWIPNTEVPFRLSSSGEG